jgi:membrane-associated phospholipid phosphatase
MTWRLTGRDEMTPRRITTVLLALSLVLHGTAFAGPVGDAPAPEPGGATTGSSLSTLSPESSPEPQPSESTAPESRESTSLRTLFRDLGGDFKHLPSRDSLIVASIGGGLALGAHSVDGTFNQRLAKDGNFFAIGSFIGNTAFIMGTSVGAYALGRATGHDRIAHVTLDFLRAEILTEAMVQSLKYTVRRERPDGSSGYAFPSGHSAVTFATCAALEGHLGFRRSIVPYAFATYVAMSRLHNNVHYLSDVVFGAAVGTIAGRTVTRHGHSNFAVVPVATPGGAAILIVRSSRP